MLLAKRTAHVSLLISVCKISILLSFFSFPFNTEPKAPPSNVQGHNTSSTKIFVQWGSVPAADQNGIILKYTVTYRAIPNGGPQTMVVDPPANEATLTGLNEFTNYSITVFASTSKGGGKESEPIIVITDEDSKYTVLLFCQDCHY